MRKKHGFLFKSGRFLGRVIVSILKGVWFVLVGIFSGLRSAGKSINKARVASKLKAQQPVTPAVFIPLSSEKDISSFERRLSDDSLIVAIAGRRGSGKSALGFRLLENIHAKSNRPAFALGVKQASLPVWIKSVESMSEVSTGGVVLVDEGAVSFSSRKSMSKENRDLASLLAIARHKDMSLIFITQNTGMIDKNILNLCDSLLFKEGSLLQEKMERSAVKEMYVSANKALKSVDVSDRKKFCYLVDSDVEALVSVELPSFWSIKVSKSRV